MLKQGGNFICTIGGTEIPQSMVRCLRIDNTIYNTGGARVSFDFIQTSDTPVNIFKNLEPYAPVELSFTGNPDSAAQVDFSQSLVVSGAGDFQSGSDPSQDTENASFNVNCEHKNFKKIQNESFIYAKGGRGQSSKKYYEELYKHYGFNKVDYRCKESIPYSEAFLRDSFAKCCYKIQHRSSIPGDKSSILCSWASPDGKEIRVDTLENASQQSPALQFFNSVSGSGTPAEASVLNFGSSHKLFDHGFVNSGRRTFHGNTGEYYNESRSGNFKTPNKRQINSTPSNNSKVNNSTSFTYNEQSPTNLKQPVDRRNAINGPFGSGPTGQFECMARPGLEIGSVVSIDNLKGAGESAKGNKYVGGNVLVTGISIRYNLDPSSVTCIVSGILGGTNE
jgi:hypothetical protein